MTNFFQFEADFVESLRCIPMQVRLKLDACGVKLKLFHWNQFNQEERQILVSLPCSNESESKAYREVLQNLVTAKTGELAGELPIDINPPWLNVNVIPDNVQKKVSEFDVDLTLEAWGKLTPLQRFALIKLSRSSHENSNFLPALKEFNLVK